MNLWTQHEARLEPARLAIKGGPAGWHPHRLIFRDWWHWRDHELGFAHGRLGLTGPNGSGKSTLLALALPILLDGDTSPRRLDPAESRDRHLQYYLLGDDDIESVFRYEARTGYLALELRHGQSGRFLTIGMGVSASRQDQRRLKDWWGFVVPARRLGRDFDVRGADGNCLGSRDLGRQLEPPAVVTTERGEYRRQVNGHLFGVNDDDFRELIGMLLAARRPKLGEQRGPEEVCQRLLESLPGIPRDRLDRVAEVVHNIEDYQRNLEEVVHRAERVEVIDGRLLDLVEVLVQEAAQQYGRTVGSLGSVVSQLKEARETHAAAGAELETLRRETEQRQSRLREIAAEREVFQAAPDADLPAQLTRAQAEAEKLAQRREDLTGRVGEQRRQVADADRELEAKAERFQTRALGLRNQLEAVARYAETLGWTDGTRKLTVAAEDLPGLRVTTPGGEILAARPDPALEPEGQQMVRAYRHLAACHRSLTEAEVAYRHRQETLNNLRKQRQARADQMNDIQDQVDERREQLARDLQRWREVSPAAEVPDHVVARVVAAVAGLTAAPERGQAGLLEPVYAAAEVRRQELEQAREEALFRQAQADCGLQEISRRLEDLQRTGLVPGRSALRAAARADGGEAWRPLFRWVRFRPGIDPDTAALVEAAALEANLLDLLLDPAGDAYLVPDPLPGGPTLLEVLEPEPGAPERVRQTLASVGWGEGPGDRWITPDGRWRSGLARGQVMPWLAEPAQLVGDDRRATALERHLAILRELRSAAEARMAEVKAERENLLTLAGRVNRELAGLDRLPWQGLFHDLAGLTSLERYVAEAQARVEAARVEEETALRSYQQEERDYTAALAGLPAARGLDERQLSERGSDLERLLDRLTALREAGYRELADGSAHYRETGRFLAQLRGALERLERDQATADEEHAAALARVKAIEQRVADPEAAALQQRIGDLDREQRELQVLQEAVPGKRERLLVERGVRAARIAELEPREEELRSDQAAQLQRLKDRLGRHPTLEPFLGAFAEEGAVPVLPRLPRPVEGDQLEEGLNERRSALVAELHLHRDALGDYRPTTDARWETVTFHQERQILTATELGLRLREAADRYRTLIAEKEQELYKSIIYQGMLDDLGKLMRRARQFTGDTNAKLKQIPLPSGEWFSLRLATLSPDTAPGAAIARTLETLGQGTEWLSAERREVLLGQIRVEVERVRQEAQARGEDLSFYEVIERALDYRRWYQYELVSHRPGVTAKPIGRRGFGTRSTSEKAWALAVPIIAGVAARYGNARQDAPRVIALDEAFAGFDPANQVNYVKFLSDLNFSWILTCPDELPYNESLSAAMAYRLTLEGTVHTAFPILWDGHRAREPLAEGWAEAAAGEQSP
ncbi:MAG TPA: hypothetical protein DEQ28_05535 [Clostridiales bacterium]|nr:hypothetical protein [Clostridiales bacterium]